MKITFYGAAQNVTGSKHLVESNGFKVLLDCGLFQGKRSIANKVNSMLPFEAKNIDAVILSHAHADHCGMLPILVKQGFTGHIYCTPATAEVAAYILKDSAKIQEQDANYINDHLRPGEDPVYPMYTVEDVEQTLKFFQPIPYFRHSGQWTKITDSMRFKLLDAGHILGSAIIVLEVVEQGVTKTVGFTGDLGPQHVPILHQPEYIEEPLAALIMECTYGDRNHRPLEQAAGELEKAVAFAVEHKSRIIVPAFALGRTQELIYVLHQLTDSQKIPRIPIYIDSPLGINITKVFSNFGNDFNQEVWKDFSEPHEWPLLFRNLNYVESVDQSKGLNTTPGPVMIIASSGMAEAGRVLFHLKNNIEDPNTIILITGYQAQHTLGRKLQEGYKTVKILGWEKQVNAQVVTVDEFSAHADQRGLLDYISHLHHPKHLFLVHTEPPQAARFKEIAHGHFPNMAITIPDLHDDFEL